MMEYSVNGRTIAYHADGDRERGENLVLLHDAEDLTKDTTWSQEGFVVESLLDKDSHVTFQREVDLLLRSSWKSAGLNVPSQMPLEKYHTIVQNLELHKQAIEKTKLVSTEDFPMGLSWIENRVSKICRRDVQALNPFDGASVFHFRVIRPSLYDNNPLHRDVWLEDYSNCINLYIPICGSDENSSLILIPKSHHWEESRVTKTKRGANIKGLQYNVPAVTEIHGSYHAIRPNPKLNEMLVFSPYLIHGGAANLNTDTTRISIELRLWPKD